MKVEQTECLVLTKAEQRTLESARLLCLWIYDHIKHDLKLEQAADNVVNDLEYLLSQAEDEEENESIRKALPEQDKS